MAREDIGFKHLKFKIWTSYTF